MVKDESRYIYFLAERLIKILNICKNVSGKNNEKTYLAAQADVGLTQFATSQMEEGHCHYSPAIALKMNVRNLSIFCSSAILHEGMEQHLLSWLTL